MKIINLFFIILLLLPASLTGQDYLHKPECNDLRNHNISPGDIIGDLPIDRENLIDPGFFSDSLLMRKPGKDYDDLINRFPSGKLYPRFRIAEDLEVYPGAPRFYSKRRMTPSPYEKSFIIKPDQSVKYYLIVKDPVTHRRIN
jgi:hypothetical protein